MKFHPGMWPLRQQHNKKRQQHKKKKTMLPLPFHPNQSSRAVLSIALIFVFSCSFCFFSMVILPHSKNIGTAPLEQPKQRKEQLLWAPPQVLSASGLSWELPSQVNPQGCPSTVSGCPKSPWSWTTGTWQQEKPSWAWKRRKGCCSTGAIPSWMLPSASWVCITMSCRAGSGAGAARSGRDGIQQLWQTSLRRGDPFICPGEGHTGSGNSRWSLCALDIRTESLEWMFDLCWVSAFTLSVISQQNSLFGVCAAPSLILVLILASSQQGRSFIQERGVTPMGLHKHLWTDPFDWPVKIRPVDWTVRVKAHQIAARKCMIIIHELQGIWMFSFSRTGTPVLEFVV